MAGATANISIRIHANLKAQVNALFAEPGMNLSREHELTGNWAVH